MTEIDKKPKWGDKINVPISSLTEEPEANFYFITKNEMISSEEIPIYDDFDINNFPKHKINYCWIKMIKDELGETILIPLIVARGENSPILGLTAAIHGNELQGIPAIHTVFKELREKKYKLKGSIVAVPCVNVIGYKRRIRYYSDGVDLNTIMPGNRYGTSSQQYCYFLLQKIIKKFNFLIDLHTASKGRINSFYVRSDLRDKMVEKMTYAFEPEIIVNNSNKKTTLRGSAMNLDIPTICVEVGDPLSFDHNFIIKAINGIFNVASLLDIVNEIKLSQNLKIEPPITYVCQRSYWIYTKHGGLLTVHPKLGELVKKDQIIASIVNIFGVLIAEYKSPEDGIIVGKADSPTNQQGDRIIHLGILWEGKNDDLPDNIEDDDD